MISGLRAGGSIKEGKMDAYAPEVERMMKRLWLM
jgi:hypothetical protein